MSFKNVVSLFCVAFIGLIAAISANAQGVIIPRPCPIRHCPRPIPRPQPLPNALPVKSIKLDTTIKGQVATTHVEQVFRNDTPYTLEGTYFFPIPETASVVNFSIWKTAKSWSVKFVPATKQGESITKSSANNAIPVYLNMPEKIFCKRQFFRFRRIPIKNLN